MKRKDSSVTRRVVLKTGAASAVGGSLATQGWAGADAARPSVYEALGLKPIVNAAGTITTLGGSVMPQEVVDAWADAARTFVDLVALQDRVGERIAALLGVEAALVTTGAAGALMLGTAAAVTRGDPDRTRRLPDTTGMKNEAIVQRAHSECYNHQITNCGVKLIEVDTRDELDRAINDRTALMLFYNLHDAAGKIRRAEWVDVARQRGIPTLIDAAADVPPLDALWKYNKMGFDMVAFSGGKALRGPNDVGLLLGRKDLIEAAKRNTSPRCNTIGRMMKVSKEDMVAMWAAIDRYVHTDHDAERREWERRIGVIEKALEGIPTIRTQHITPSIANHVPHVLIHWDEDRVRIARDQVKKTLADGDPPIATARIHHTGTAGFLISVFMLRPGEDRIVASRLRDILQQASA